MEKLYNTYKDVAEFRMVYIREAHAIDGPSPMRGGRGGPEIKEHQSFEQRCETAEMFVKDKSLTMPMLIDNMDNSADQAYSAKPDRVFLVRTDGRLGVAADRGPWGFKPGLEACEDWLKEFKKSGAEKEIAESVIEAADKKTAARKASTNVGQSKNAAQASGEKKSKEASKKSDSKESKN